MNMCESLFHLVMQQGPIISPENGNWMLHHGLIFHVIAVFFFPEQVTAAASPLAALTCHTPVRPSLKQLWRKSRPISRKMLVLSRRAYPLYPYTQLACATFAGGTSGFPGFSQR